MFDSDCQRFPSSFVVDLSYLILTIVTSQREVAAATRGQTAVHNDGRRDSTWPLGFGQLGRFPDRPSRQIDRPGV